MDFKGQQLSETLCMYLVIQCAMGGFLWGYLNQSFSQMMTVFAGGVALATLITVPDWPMYNKNPVAWLPPREQPGGPPKRGGSGGDSSRKLLKKESWRSLWGAM